MSKRPSTEREDLLGVPDIYAQSQLRINDGLPYTVSLYLTAEIIRRQLQTNDRFPVNEKDLCDALGVGRDTVRLAWKILASRQLVKVQHGKGVIMKDLQLLYQEDTAQTFFQIRKEAEKGLAREAAKHATNENILLLKERLDSFSEAVNNLLHANNSVEKTPRNQTGVFNLFQSDLKFHAAVHRVSQDTWLVMVAEIAEVKTQVLWYHGLRTEAALKDLIAIHSEIYEAIKAHDVDWATQSVENHFQHAHQSADQALKLLALPSIV